MIWEAGTGDVSGDAVVLGTQTVYCYVQQNECDCP